MVGAQLGALPGVVNDLGRLLGRLRALLLSRLLAPLDLLAGQALGVLHRLLPLRAVLRPLPLLLRAVVAEDRPALVGERLDPAVVAAVLLADAGEAVETAVPMDVLRVQAALGHGPK